MAFRAESDYNFNIASKLVELSGGVREGGDMMVPASPSPRYKTKRSCFPLLHLAMPQTAFQYCAQLVTLDVC